MGSLRVAQIITTLARGGAQATVMASRSMGEFDIDVTVLAGLDDPGEGTYWHEAGAGIGRWGQLAAPEEEGLVGAAATLAESGDVFGVRADADSEHADAEGTDSDTDTGHGDEDDQGTGDEADDGDPDEGLDQASWVRPVVAVPPLRRMIHPVNDRRALRWLIDWLSENQPDVVHTHSSKAGVLGRRAAAAVGIPCVHTVHGWSFAADRGAANWRAGLSRRAVIRLERRLAAKTRALVVVTPDDAETGLDWGIGVAEQYHVIRSGIDLDIPRQARSERDEIRAQRGWDDDELVVGTVGRLAPQKDLTTLIMGFAQAGMEPSRLVLIGAGAQEEELRRLAISLGVADQVEFLGARLDAPRLVAGFDVFALTSRWEGLPRALVEAMAAQVPVITTRAGGVAELVTNGKTGTMIPMGDPQALAAALQSHQNQPKAARKRATRAAAQVEPFSIDEMRAELARLWSNVAGRGVGVDQPPAVDLV